MSAAWSKCTLKVPNDLAESFAWLLAQALDHPVETQDRSTMSRWADTEHISIVVSFEGQPPSALYAVADTIAAQLNLNAVSIHTETIVDDSWKEGWKAYFEPQMISDKLCVYPPWKERPSVPFALEIEPGMAFGTGTHETTQMMLRMMLKHLHTAPQTDVLDVGAGSGILSIAASQFGHRVSGIEIDPVAVENAIGNLERNTCTDVAIRVGTLTRSEPTRPWVLVNILARIILGMRDEIAKVSAQNLLLSGFLHDQREEMLAAFPDFGIVDEETMGPWGCLLLERASE